MNQAPLQQDKHPQGCPFLAEQRLPAKSLCPLITGRHSMEMGKVEGAAGAVS